MTRAELGDALALANATLNASSALLMVLGRRAIAAGRRDAHRRFMLGAVGTSAIFLATYLTRVELTGTHVDPHRGAVHAIYLFILFTHMILAMAVVPLVLLAVLRALKNSFDRHKEVVRYAFPIWLYVSVTGVLVYLILYHLPA